MRYEYTDKKKGYLVERIREHVKTSLNIPKDVLENKEEYKEYIALVKAAHSYAVTETTFRKNLNDRLNHQMCDYIEYNRYIQSDLIDVYVSKVAEFIFVVFDDHNHLLYDEPIGSLKGLIKTEACSWMYRVLREIQEIFLEEGILRHQTDEEIEDEKWMNSQYNDIMFGGYDPYEQ